MTDETKLNDKMGKLTASSPSKKYTPPHARNQAAKPPVVPSAFSNNERYFLVLRFRNRVQTQTSRSSLGSASQSSSNWGQSYGQRDSGFNRSGNYSRGPKKSPDDEFYHRQDVQGRDPRLESKLFGNIQNSGINFKNYDDIPVISMFNLG
jgi:hypothetical protein